MGLQGKIMKKPIKSNSELENAIEPFVAAAKVPRLFDACRILFVNGESLTLSAELEQIGMVALEKLERDNVVGADLLVSQSQLQLLKIGQEVLPRFLQGFSGLIGEAIVGITSVQNEEEHQSILAARIVEKVKSQGEGTEFWKLLAPYIGGAIKPFAELLVGSLYKLYYEKHNAQHQTIAELNETVASLKRLGLLMPFLSLGLCPVCNNYELVFSRLAKFSLTCAQCGSAWSVLTVNEFPQPLAALKRQGKDLPVFISAYLKSKSALPVDVFPNAEFDLPNGKVEVDVFVPDMATGIECKCYTNNIAVAESTIASEAGKIKQQIENYLATGITRVLVITNYSDSDVGKLNVQLKEQLKHVNGLREWKILSGDIMKFITFLNEEASKLGDVVNRRWQKRFEHRVTKKLPERTKGKESS
jgi:hypothetical protein